MSRPMKLTVRHDPVFVRRRRVAMLLVAVVAAFTGIGLVKMFSPAAEAAPPAKPPAPAAARSAYEVAAPPLAKVAQGPVGASADTRLVRLQRLVGDLASKSVVASSHGQVFAQNMMYEHTVVAFDADGNRVRTISDAVRLGDYGVDGHPGTVKGAPVEMAFSPDGRTGWVSNYAMYGAGFLPEGKDACTSPTGQSPSFLYKVDVATHRITAVVKVGVVPKYVAATPDGRQVLVTNWCSMDLTVIDAATARVTTTIPLGGKHPRGIAVRPDSKVAYVALMGSDRVVAVDLPRRSVRAFAQTGDGPRHLVISPDGRTLYVSNNGADTVTSVDAASGRVTGSVRTGDEPRSMTISPDGGALYVVAYKAARVEKIRTRDLSVVQTVPTDPLPIGITYEPTRKRVWVACYGGSILVLDDSRLSA